MKLVNEQTMTRSERRPGSSGERSTAVSELAKKNDAPRFFRGKADPSSATTSLKNKKKENAMVEGRSSPQNTSEGTPPQLMIGRFKSLRRMLSSNKTNRGEKKKRDCSRVQKTSCAQVPEDGQLDSLMMSKEKALSKHNSTVPKNVSVHSPQHSGEDIKYLSDLEEGSSESSSSGQHTASTKNPASEASSSDAAHATTTTDHNIVLMTPKTKLINEQQEEIEMLRAKMKRKDERRKKRTNHPMHIVEVSNIEWTNTTLPATQKKTKTQGGGMYSGPAIKGVVPHGPRGVVKFQNGDVYEGPFKFGEMHGAEATFRAANGDIYKGDYWHNLKHGPAAEEVYATTGHRFKGSFQFGSAHGFGVEYGADGSVAHLGQWDAGKPVVVVVKEEEETRTTAHPLKDTVAKCSEREDRMRRYLDQAIIPSSQSPKSSHSSRSMMLGKPSHSRLLVGSPVIAADIPGYDSDDDSTSTSESSGVDELSSIYNWD